MLAILNDDDDRSRDISRYFERALVLFRCCRCTARTSRSRDPLSRSRSLSLMDSLKKRKADDAPLNGSAKRSKLAASGQHDEVLGVALVGYGRVGSIHARNLLARSDVRLLHVVGRDEKRAREFVASLGVLESESVQVHSSLEPVLADGAVHAVVIASASGTRSEAPQLATRCPRLIDRSIVVGRLSLCVCRGSRRAGARSRAQQEARLVREAGGARCRAGRALLPRGRRPRRRAPRRYVPGVPSSLLPPLLQQQHASRSMRQRTDRGRRAWLPHTHTRTQATSVATIRASPRSRRPSTTAPSARCSSCA